MKGFILLTFLHCYSPLKDVRTGTQKRSESYRQELMQRPQERNTAYWLISLPWSACFLLEHRTTIPWMTQTTMCWVLPYCSLIEKLSYSWLRELFSHLKTSLCQILSSLCQDDTHPVSIVETDREGRLQNRQSALCRLGLMRMKRRRSENNNSQIRQGSQ